MCDNKYLDELLKNIDKYTIHICKYEEKQVLSNPYYLECLYNICKKNNINIFLLNKNDVKYNLNKGIGGIIGNNIYIKDFIDEKSIQFLRILNHELLHMVYIKESLDCENCGVSDRLIECFVEYSNWRILIELFNLEVNYTCRRYIQVSLSYMSEHLKSIFFKYKDFLYDNYIIKYYSNT